MCGSMVDIQSPTAEIRRGKKEERKIEEKETTGQKYSGLNNIHVENNVSGRYTADMKSNQIHEPIVELAMCTAVSRNFEHLSRANSVRP